MPDQSSASSEHALIQEITAPLATLHDDPVPSVADVDFPVVLRGYDRIAVDAYVRQTSQLVAELQATRSPEAAVRRALERVGEEVSGILQRAHDTAEKITANSRSEAEDRLDAAREEAARIVSAAETRVKDLDAETDRIWGERHRIVEDTRELARQLVGLADSASERFPAEEVAPEAPAGSEDAEPTVALPGPIHFADEDETLVAEGEEVDWGAAEEWHPDAPQGIAEPPEYEESPVPHKAPEHDEPGEETQATAVHETPAAQEPASEEPGEPEPPGDTR
jgi:DivIVA domain-containing protein